jgi:hypothetical protein
MADPVYRDVTHRCVTTGQHRPPADGDWVTTAYFHLPEELEAEVVDAGFRVREHVGVEGPGWLLPDLAERWTDADLREQVMGAAARVERAPSLRGRSAHVMVVGERV